MPEADESLLVSVEEIDAARDRATASLTDNDGND
jgi:hypothetical protein